MRTPWSAGRVQAENSLTFTCEEVPAVDLTVYIVIITLA